MIPLCEFVKNGFPIYHFSFLLRLLVSTLVSCSVVCTGFLLQYLSDSE